MSIKLCWRSLQALAGGQDCCSRSLVGMVFHMRKFSILYSLAVYEPLCSFSLSFSFDLEALSMFGQIKHCSVPALWLPGKSIKYLNLFLL
jgi:hypothetical protein